jgi:hypothetical protein
MNRSTAGRAVPLSLAALVLVGVACSQGDRAGEGVSLTTEGLERPGRGCAPGHVVCEHRCIDPSSDSGHCGMCGNRCPQGTDCVSGVCGTPKADFAFGALQEVDGANASQFCIEANEGYPERSAWGNGNLDMPFQTYSSIGGTGATYNWASAWNAWNAPQGIPFATAPGDPYAPYVSSTSDNWATTSGNTAMEYVSAIIQEASSPFQACLGIAATPYYDIASNVWQYPYACATTPISGTPDGPSIHYDLGGETLWGVYDNAGEIELHTYAPCNAGRPTPFGTTGPCAESMAPVAVAFNAVGHATVTANPCTHHAVVGYRDGNLPNAVHLAIYDGSTLEQDFVVDGNAAWGATTACSSLGCNPPPTDPSSGQVPICNMSCTSPDCIDQLHSAGNGCARVASKIHVATKWIGGSTCYAYVAYDSLSNGTMAANLRIVDISVEGELASKQSYSWAGNGNSFGSIVSASEFTPNVGWFFYWQTPDACNTHILAGTDASNGSNLAYHLIDGPFPTMRFAEAFGLGDYIGIIKRGLPGGYLFPTWSKPVQTASSCVSCESTSYALGIFGTQVIP